MNYDDKLLIKWRIERDAAVKTLDVKTFRAFYRRWQERGIYHMGVVLPSDEVVKRAVCKMACNIPTMPDEVKTKAAEWLYANGSSPEM